MNSIVIADKIVSLPSVLKRFDCVAFYLQNSVTIRHASGGLVVHGTVSHLQGAPVLYRWKWKLPKVLREEYFSGNSRPVIEMVADYWKFRKSPVTGDFVRLPWVLAPYRWEKYPSAI